MSGAPSGSEAAGDQGRRPGPVPDRRSVRDERCELCEAARLTEWFFEDDDCWVAECEACSVPMVVWRRHDADPPDDVKAALHARLVEVVNRHFDAEVWIDDRLRSIPDHYHAHARPTSGFGRGPLRRR